MRSASSITICYVAGAFWRGGAERQLIYMLHALRGSPLTCRVLTLDDTGLWEPEVRKLGVSVEHVGRPTSRLARQVAIIRALRKGKADIVQSAHFYTNTYAAVGARAVNAVSIGAIRNDLRSEVAGNGLFGWGHLLLPHYMFANSEPALDQALEYRRSPSRVLLVENVVDAGRFAPPADPRVRRSEQTMRLLFIGRLIPQKRADRFIRLVRRVMDELPGWTVEARIAGDGPLRPELEVQAAGLHFPAGSVRFIGRIDDVGALYDWADALILPSDFEGTPNVVLEAMAQALPVVANAVSGVPALLSQGGGLLVDPLDEDALVASVVRLAEEPGLRLRLGDQGRRYVCSARSIQALRPRLERIYRSILEDRR